MFLHRSALADEQGKVANLNGKVLQVQMELQQGQQKLDSEKTASAELSRRLSSVVEVCAGSFNVFCFFICQNLINLQFLYNTYSLVIRNLTYNYLALWKMKVRCFNGGAFLMLSSVLENEMH